MLNLATRKPRVRSLVASYERQDDKDGNTGPSGRSKERTSHCTFYGMIEQNDLIASAGFDSNMLRRRRNEARAFLYAFHLLELDGIDLRREPIEVRNATLTSFLRKSRPGVRLNEHLEHDSGLTVFQHACKIGLEGIVSKRLGSRYTSGRTRDWLKFKNPDAPAVKREAGARKAHREADGSR
jgi:hypothetical protein